MDRYGKSAQILECHRKFIPGGVVSVNRATDPAIVFVWGQCSISFAHTPSDIEETLRHAAQALGSVRKR